MEYGLGLLTEPCNEDSMVLVLILVVMEYGLGHIKKIGEGKYFLS